MNREERQLRRKLQERDIFLTAAKYDSFNLNQIWKEVLYHHGFVSTALLKWWREEGLTERWNAWDQRWERGYIFSKVQKGSPAYYRWIEPKCENDELTADDEA